MNARIGWALFWCASAAFGQQFDVASVKPAGRSSADFLVRPGGRLQITGLNLRQIIREAYEVKRSTPVSGGPGWLTADEFNIEAKAGREASRSEMMAMLRALLEDRFQLSVRREQREGNVYELVVAKGGPKLKASSAETSHLFLQRHTPPDLPGVSYTIDAQKVTIARVADHLMGTVGRPVFDRTGISGEFDFKIDYAVEGHADEGPSIFTALPEQVGLRLQAGKGPVETLVVERAERLKEN